MNLIGELLLQKMCIINPEQLFIIAYILRRIYTDVIRAFEKWVQIEKGWQSDRQSFYPFAYELKQFSN